MAVSQAQLTEIYLAYFGRPPDFDGLVYYTSNPDFTIWTVAAGFSASPESVALYGPTFNAAQINAIYQNLFNRDAEPAGLLYWSQEVASGRLTAAGAALGILLGAQNDDLVAVNNKLAVSAAFVAALNTSDEITGYTGTEAAASARDFLHTVDWTADSLADAMAGLDAAVAAAVEQGGPAGETFTLTISKDTVVGTMGNDTIEVLQASGTFGNPLSTLNEFDVIDGAAGTDTMNVYVSAPGEDGGSNIEQLGTVTNVEIINVFNMGEDTFGFGEIDAAGFEGATQIWQHFDQSNIYNLASSTVAGFRDDEHISTTYISAAAASTSISIALDNIGEADDGGEEGWFNASGATLNAVNIAGALVADTDPDDDSYVGLTFEAGKNVASVAVNSSVNVTVNVQHRFDSTKNVTTVDASGSTGGVEFWAASSVNGGVAIATISTGSGDDFVSATTATLKDDAATVAVNTKTATVSTGAGGDEVEVYTTGTGTTTVDAGAGDDSVLISTRGTGKLTVALGAGDDEFNSDAAITGTDAVDGGEGTDGLLLSLVGASNIAAFSNFEVFDAVGLANTLDVEILASQNTVTEIITTGYTGEATLINLGAGVGFRAVGDMTSADWLTLTQKTAGALTVTSDIDDGEAAAVYAHVEATNATSLTAVFDNDYEDEAVENVSVMQLGGVAATTLNVVSGGTNTTNDLTYWFGPVDTTGTGASGLLTSVTITGDTALNFWLGDWDGMVGIESNVATVNAADFTGGLTFDTDMLKNKGSVTLGSGVDVITVGAASVEAGMESIVGFEKAVAAAIAAAPDALAIADSDSLSLVGGTAVAAADVDNANGATTAKGVITFTGAGPATLAAAIGIAEDELDAGEVAVFKYLNDSYAYVDGGTVVKLTGITGVTTVAEVGTSDMFILG